VNAAAPSSLASGRIPELDGLRGIAIAMVLVCHYFVIEFAVRHEFLAAFLNGSLGLMWSGVDLFFVLSGFLIGGILLDARESTNFFGVFYTRRFFRIVPIYALVLLLFPIGAAALRLAPAGGFSWLFANPMPWYSYTTFTQNFWMAGRGSEGANWLAPTWSLAVEEQFYLTLPLAIRLLSRRNLIRCLVVFICWAPVLRIALMSRWPSNGFVELVLMPCRADALLMGVLTAVAIRDREWRKRITRSTHFFPVLIGVLVAGVALLGRFAPGIPFLLMRSIGFTWLALFYVSVLLFALTRPDSLLSRTLRNRGLAWLGAIAYGVYLTHQAVQGLIYGYFGRRPPGILDWSDFLLVLTSLAITLAICRLSWTYFEKPLVQMGHRAKYEFAGAPDRSFAATVPAGGN
jgi:peptidoglycan/LPS O-acetylase OafA/YrhL